MGPDIGDVYLEVHADTKGFSNEVRRAAALAGRGAGADFGNEFNNQLDKKLSTTGYWLRRQMAKDGEDARQYGKDPKITCTWTANLMSGIFAKPAPEAAGIYRWLLAQK